MNGCEAIKWLETKNAGVVMYQASLCGYDTYTIIRDSQGNYAWSHSLNSKIMSSGTCRCLSSAQNMAIMASFLSNNIGSLMKCGEIFIYNPYV